MYGNLRPFKILNLIERRKLRNECFWMVIKINIIRQIWNVSNYILVQQINLYLTKSCASLVNFRAAVSSSIWSWWLRRAPVTSCGLTVHHFYRFRCSFILSIEMFIECNTLYITRGITPVVLLSHNKWLQCNVCPLTSFRNVT